MTVRDGESGLSGVEIQIRDPQGRWQKVVRAYDVDGNIFSTSISWDRTFADGTLAPVGEYDVLVKASDLAGNFAQETAHILIPAPGITPSPLPTRQVEPAETRTLLPTFTATPKISQVVADAPTLTPARTPIVTAFGETVVQSVPSPISQSQSQSSSNVLWGAAAAAAIGAATAYALEQRRKRKEEEARQRAEAQAEAARRNAAEEARKAQAYLLAQIAAQQAAQEQSSSHRGEEAKIDHMEEAEGAAKTAKPQRGEQAYQDYRAGERDAEAIAAEYQARKAVQEYRQGERAEVVSSMSACVQTPTPETLIGPAPTPTAMPPALSGKDVVNGICEAADAVDPVMPNPETVGGPDVGDLIDQAYIWQQSVPVVSPQSEAVFRLLVRAPISVAKTFKDGPSAVVNFICQQREGAGPYYELFPIDQKVQAIKNWWNGMNTQQKIFVVGFTVLTLLVAIPAIMALLG